MAYLSRQKQTALSDDEINMRTSFQNAFAGASTDDEAFKIAHNIIEPTITNEVIRTVDGMMKKVKSK